MTKTMIFTIYEGHGETLTYLPPMDFSRLAHIYPEGVLLNPIGERRFECKLCCSDRRLPIILDALKDLGLAPGVLCNTQKRTFGARIDREYVHSDLVNLSYMRPKPKQGFTECDYRSSEGLLEFDRITKGQATLSIGYAAAYGIVVSSMIRSEFEKINLKHLLFRELQITGKGKAYRNQFWELTSDKILPSLAPCTELVNAKAEKFDGDLTKGCYLMEGVYSEPECHYLENDIRAAEPFDMALTSERFGISEDNSTRILVASKRYYEVCLVLKLKMDWIPVRIDP